MISVDDIVSLKKQLISKRFRYNSNAKLFFLRDTVSMISIPPCSLNTRNIVGMANWLYLYTATQSYYYYMLALIIWAVSCYWGEVMDGYKNKHNTDSKVHGANMGPTWVLSAPDGPHHGPMNLVIREYMYSVINLPSPDLFVHPKPEGQLM